MYQRKLLCTMHYAQNHNPSQLEAPWYKAWDLVLNEFICSEEEYSICPQDVLCVERNKTHSRYPDFTMYLTTSDSTVLQNFRATRHPIMVVEVKPWWRKYAENRNLLASAFTNTKVMGQVLEQGKFIFERSGVEIRETTAITAILAIGHMWKYVRLQATDTSPYDHRSIPSQSPSLQVLVWSEMYELGTPASVAALHNVRSGM